MTDYMTKRDALVQGLTNDLNLLIQSTVRDLVAVYTRAIGGPRSPRGATIILRPTAPAAKPKKAKTAKRAMKKTRKEKPKTSHTFKGVRDVQKFTRDLRRRLKTPATKSLSGAILAELQKLGISASTS